MAFVKETKFPFATSYFSCLDTRKVTKESQEILNSPSAQTVGFHRDKYKIFHFNDWLIKFKHALKPFHRTNVEKE